MTTVFFNRNAEDSNLSQEFLDGEAANYAGQLYDEDQSPEWQRGWDSAQVVRSEWESVCDAAGDGFTWA